MQQAFGESENNIIINIKLKDGEIDIEELELNLPKKKIVNLDVSKLDDFKIKENSTDKIRLTITGDYDEFKTFKKTEKYKELNNQGVKVVFRHKKNKNIEVKHELKDVVDFTNILNNLVSSSKNKNLIRAYEYIINDKKLNEDDIFFV
jgi:hypothetical protein